MTMRPAWILAAAALFIAGCPPGTPKCGEETNCADPTDDNEGGPHCEETITDSTLDADYNGFSGQDVVDLATLGSPWVETMSYSDDTETDLTVTIAPTSTVRHIDSVAVYPDDGTEQEDIGVICNGRVEVDVQVTFASADGAFDEVLDVALSSEDGTTAFFYAELDHTDLGGDFDLADHIDEPDADEMSLDVSMTFDGEECEGSLAGMASGEDECNDGEDCAAWAAMIEVATF